MFHSTAVDLPRRTSVGGCGYIPSTIVSLLVERLALPGPSGLEGRCRARWVGRTLVSPESSGHWFTFSSMYTTKSLIIAVLAGLPEIQGYRRTSHDPHRRPQDSAGLPQDTTGLTQDYRRTTAGHCRTLQDYRKSPQHTTELPQDTAGHRRTTA